MDDSDLQGRGMEWHVGSSDEERLDELENKLQELEERNGHSGGGLGCWGLGAAIAVTLSWSRNASILYCIGHGILSWGYVVYFAFTRGVQ